ncbi:MAG: hypothetical protein AB1486_24740 [Planctomycetota bacterium]
MAPHTRVDRQSALVKLGSFIDTRWAVERENASEEFWGHFHDRKDELPSHLSMMSRDVEETWFAFDYTLPHGRRVVDEFLGQAVVSPGERSFLMEMRRSTMRLYEVTDTQAGVSMTLRDLLEGSSVTVSERTGSKSIARHSCLAARVIAQGCSGQPEMETGVLHIPDFWRDQVLTAVTEERKAFLRQHPAHSVHEFYKTLPQLFHDAWLTSIFEPAVPRLANTDGEELVITRMSFHVDDERALRQALDGAESEGITSMGDRAWSWSGPSKSRGDVTLASLELDAAVLTVEANSVERGTRARDLIERLAGTAIRHRETTHEDVRHQVMEEATARMLGQSNLSEQPDADELDPDINEALMLQYYSTHYRNWVDEPVPALDGQTPREAAKSSDLRPRVEELIRDLERMYEQALKCGEPAYDPSWMWEELELAADTDPSHPPPLAHERVAERVPGSAEASRAAAERVRALPSFSDKSTIVEEQELSKDLELQRFVRGEVLADEDARKERSLAKPYLPLMVNFELHRRKLFWVDGPLSYMLESTDVDVAGRELRTPFSSFAVVFTDRHALSLGERLLARDPKNPLRGQILRVATVYVTERHGDERALSITFAFDALGADLPSLVHFQVPSGDETSLRAYLESLAPLPEVEPEICDRNPARALMRLVLNAILYATSAGVTPEVRPVARRKRHAGSPPSPQPESDSPESDSVFFLPGKIDIRRVRQLKELARAPGGRKMFARFMVRGHWRRAAANWTDQRLRWIEPYWKGPDLAAVIEKAYRLRE